MADPNTEGEETTTPPPTEEEQQTETVDDEVKPKEEPEPEPSEPDVSARLDSIEKELAALKAMLDTLGYTEPAPSDNDGDNDGDGESIEDLFD
jgi:hypothetical protein